MPLYLDSFKNNPPNGVLNNFYVQGLSDFMNVLEKDFFSKATVRKCASEGSEIKLVVELVCDLSLLELLYHFDKNVWGGFVNGESSLSSTLHVLRGKNENHIEIEEFSIFLKDTSIIINCIYENSITEQLNTILIELSNHFVHFTKGLNEIPYEIYMPVEEATSENDGLIKDVRMRGTNPKNYYNFWALYYESEDDAVIYDLKNSSATEGDLYMLNH